MFHSVQERCSSGWRGYPGKVVYPQGYRGFESHLLRKMFEKIYKTFVILISCTNIYAIFLYVSLFIGMHDLLFSNFPDRYSYLVSPFLFFPLNFILALLLLTVSFFRSKKNIYYRLSIINLFIPILWILFIVIYITLDPTSAE